METLILIAHVVLAVALIALVLLQQGKGAEAGAAFGSGASQTMFGSQGTGSFLGRVTGIIALGIFITSFTLAVYAKQKAESISDQGVPSSLVSEESAQQAPELKEIVQPSTDVPKAE